MSMNAILFAVFFIGFMSSLAGLLFYMSYRRLPFVVATVHEVSVTEKTAGNALILTIWIHYEVHGTKRYKTIVLSGYARGRSKLLARAARIQNYYKDKQTKYYYLPGLTRIGVLDGSITREHLWAYVLITVIFAIVSGVILVMWSQ